MVSQVSTQSWLAPLFLGLWWKEGASWWKEGGRIKLVPSEKPGSREEWEPGGPFKDTSSIDLCLQAKPCLLSRPSMNPGMS